MLSADRLGGTARRAGLPDLPGAPRLPGPRTAAPLLPGPAIDPEILRVHADRRRAISLQRRPDGLLQLGEGLQERRLDDAPVGPDLELGPSRVRTGEG